MKTGEMSMNYSLELKESLPIAENQQVINAFLLEEFEKKNKKRGTLLNYRHHLKCLFKDMAVPIDLIQPDDIYKWLMMKKEEWNDDTIKGCVSVLRVFFRFCVKEGYIDQSPAEQINRKKRKVTNYWEVDCELPNAENKRVINEFLFHSKNIDKKEITIRHYRSKLFSFFNTWEKPFSSITLEEIQQWLHEEQKKSKSNIYEQYINSLRCFYSYCEEEGYIINPPVKRRRWNRTTENYWEIKQPLKNKENQEIIHQYLLNLKNKKKNNYTIVEYRIALHCFFQERNESFSSITRTEIDKWINESLKDKKKKTVENKLSALRNFYRFCTNQGFIDESPVKFMWERERDHDRYWELKNPVLNNQNHQVINEYLLSMKLANLSEETIKNRRFFLEGFFKSQKESFDQLTSESIQEWFIERKQIWKETTVSNYLGILSTFYNYCVEEEYLETSPMKSRWFPRLPSSVPKYLEKDQIAKIRMMSEKQILRNLVIVEFLYATGCRIGELYNLNRTDVDINNRTALVFGKGKKFRAVHFTEKCALYLERYLETRDDTHPALILSNRETRLGIQRMQTIISKIGKQVKLDGSLHPHRFRHTFATELLAKGADLSFIADELGHSDIQTTLVYARLPKQELILMYRKYMG